MEKKRAIKHYRDLDVYRLAFVCAMKIFNITKSFPVEERYSMADQMRRSSRSVCSNFAEGWRTRSYEAVFKNKLTDSMQEASETQCWLEFANACSYITQDQFKEFDKEYERIIAMLNGMEKHSKKFCF